MLRQPNNVFVEFCDKGIREKKGGNTFAAQNKDFGIVLKLPSLRFPGHFFFVCAGLGVSGASGAAWYLATKWRELLKYGDSFGVVVEVEIGADETARKVFPKD